MHPIVRHHGVIASLSSNLYFALGPWPQGAILETLILDIASTVRDHFVIVPVLHASDAPNAATIQAGTPILDQATTRHLGVNAFGLIPNTTTSSPHALPLHVLILSGPQYLHVLIHDSAAVAGTKTVSLHITAKLQTHLITPSLIVTPFSPKLPPPMPPPLPPPLITPPVPTPGIDVPTYPV